MLSRFFIIAASVSGFLAVALGAFAAHSLKSVLSPESLQVMQIGVQYQMYHALALLGVGIFLARKPDYPGLNASGIAFILGSFLFSGSLYALALGAPRWIGPVTPLGGLCLIAGWLLLAYSAWRAKH